MTTPTTSVERNPNIYADFFAASELSSALTRKDIRKASETLGRVEARFMVDYYYTMQRDRIRFDNQVRSMTKSGEPNMILDHLAVQAAKREEIIKKALDDYTSTDRVGTWLRSICGIGPVTAAGLLAYIDIERAVTAGAIWKLAGLVPGVEWNKGEKRPWNAKLKCLMFKIGESFVKTSNKESSFYGKIYKERKELETRRNENGDFAEQAAKELASKNYAKNTPTYAALSAGRLSPAHIHVRARRYAVKLFLSHLHEVMYLVILKKAPPSPYAISILEHAHRIPVPELGAIKDFIDPVADDIETPFDDEMGMGSE